MIEATALKKGLKIAIDGVPYEVIDFQLVHLGRGRGHVRARLKNLKTGAVWEKTFDSSVQFEEPDLTRRKMQFLYENQGEFFFMDADTYEQVNISGDILGDSKYYLIEGESYEILFFEGEPISVNLPVSVVLEVTYTEPGIKGDSVTNIMKEAVLQTGLKVRVPLFINVGDKVKIDTRTGEYLGRV